MSSNDVVIVAAKRTPIGAFQGVLTGAAAPELGAAAIAGILAESGIEGADVDQVLMGCVLSAGLGQAPARQAAISAGIPVGTACTTVNKMFSIEEDNSIRFKKLILELELHWFQIDSITNSRTDFRTIWSCTVFIHHDDIVRMMRFSCLMVEHMELC